MSKARILVVEDNHDNMTLITDVLHSLDYDVIAARDGEDGLKTAKDEKPALILLDLSLPKMDGWTVARSLKSDSDPDVVKIPIIALTAHAMVGDREKAIAAGCNDYLSKPINLRELASKLNQYLKP